MSSRATKWGAGLIINILALSLASYLALIYRYAPTRRILAETASGTDADIQMHVSDDYGRNVSALLLSVLIGSVATAAGIGGGAFFVPLFNILLRFSVKGAIALSQAVIAGGAVAGVAVTLHKKHPHDPSKPLMDFDIALMLLPFQLLGVSVGMLANVLFPDWLVTMLLLGLLIFLTYKTARKAWSLHRAEVRYLAQRAEERPRPAAADQRVPAAGCLPVQPEKRSEVKYLAQQAKGQARQAVPDKRVSVEDCPAVGIGEKRGRLVTDKQGPNRDSAACGSEQGGQAGADAQQSQPPLSEDLHDHSVEAKQYEAPRQCASLEVEGPSNCLSPVDVGSSARGEQLNQQLRRQSPGHVEISMPAQQHDSKGRVASLPDTQTTQHADISMPAQQHVGEGQVREPPRRLSLHHAEVSMPGQEHDSESQVREPPAWRQGAVLLLCWGIFVMFTLLLSHYHRCSPAYWSIFAVQAATCIGAEALFIGLVRKRKARQARSRVRQPMLQSAYSQAPQWTSAQLTRTVLITLISGVIAGLLGISGASIVNPLLLEFGIHPQAAAATSTLMVLFTSSSAALSFGFGHQLNLQFALVFGLCCMGASLIGVILVQRIVKRSGKASIIVFLLALVIATGACLTAAFGGKIAILDLARHNNVRFSSLCSGDVS